MDDSLSASTARISAVKHVLFRTRRRVDHLRRPQILGTIIIPELPAYFAWGDRDLCSLHLAARTSLYSIRLLTAGSVDIALAGR